MKNNGVTVGQPVWEAKRRVPRRGESRDDYGGRRDALEAAVRRLHDESAQAEAVVVAVGS